MVIWELDETSSTNLPESTPPVFAYNWSVAEGGSTLAWSHDSITIATAGVNVFSLTAGEKIAVLEGQTHYFNYGMVWSPDGKFIAALTGTSLQIWATDTWQQSLIIPVNSSFDGCVPLAWHPSGKSLIHAATGGTCHEYDSGTGACRSTSLLLSAERYAVFSPNSDSEVTTGLNEELVAVLYTESGQQFMTPAEFAELTKHASTIE